MFDFLTLNDFKFSKVDITISEDGKKDVRGLESGWSKQSVEVLLNKFKKHKNVKTISVNGRANFIIIDTDEEPQYKYFTELLKSKDLYNEEAITCSYRGRLLNLDYKKHFWFRVDEEEFQEVPNKGNKRNGYDILYNTNSFSFEWFDSTVDNIPTLSISDYTYLYEKMESKFPKEGEEKTKKQTKKPKVEINENTETTDEQTEGGEYKNIDRLLSGLSSARFNEYDYWLTMAMVFINEKLPISIFNKYSKERGTSKYNKSQNDEIIKRLKLTTSGYRIATLYKWLKQDNYELFEELQRERTDFWSMLFYQDKLQHSDFAHIYYNLEPNKYVRSHLTGWYEYNEYNILQHRDKTPTSLLNSITNKLQKYIIEQRNYLTPNMKDYDIKNKLVKTSYQQVGNSGFVKGIIDYLTNLYTVENLDDLLDKNNSVLAFTDKLYDVTNNTFRDIKPQDYITKTTGYKAPTSRNKESKKYILKTLYSIFENNDMVDYWLITTSLALFTTKTESVYIHTGSGGNGKGLMSDLIRVSLGDYFFSPENTFLTTTFKAGTPNPSLFKCKGIRYLLVSEPDDGKDNTFNVDFIKMMSGGDVITTRTLYQSVMTSYIPQFTTFCQCNQKPKLKKFDKGLVRRIKIIDYPFNFVDKPEKPNDRLRDYELKNTLSQPDIRDEFIQILFDYATVWINKKINDIKIPEDVQKYTAEYLEENNPVKMWIDTRLITTGKKTDSVKTSDAYDDFKINFKESYLDNKGFMQGLKVNDMVIIKSNGYNKITGVKFRNDENEEVSDSDTD